jgi:hypothetical protein
VSLDDPGTAVAGFGFPDRDGVELTEPEEEEEEEEEEPAGSGSVVAADGPGFPVGADGINVGVMIAGPPGSTGSGWDEPDDNAIPSATAATVAPAGTASQRHSRRGGRGAATVGGTPRFSRSCVI